MMRKFTGVLIATMALAFVIASSTRADAALVLQLSEQGFTTQTFSGPAAYGPLPFGDYIVTNDSGLGSNPPPNMDLSFQVQTGATAPTHPLIIELTLTGLTTVGNASFSIGGTNPGTTVTYVDFWDSNNVAFGTTTTDPAFAHQIGVLESFSPGTNFGMSGSGVGPTGGTYSLTEMVTITQAANKISSGDASLSVPEPASMALFGMGLLGLAARRRRILG